MTNYQIDTVDRSILAELQRDARIPFTEIAHRLNLSHGTIHQRVDRMRALGIIRGMSIDIDPTQIGYTLLTFIGVVLEKPGEYRAVLKRLERHPEVTEAYYTTGAYTFIMKVYSRSIQHLHQFLTETVQKIALVRSTETIVVMDIPLERKLGVEELS